MRLLVLFKGWKITEVISLSEAADSELLESEGPLQAMEAEIDGAGSSIWIGSSISF